MVFLLLDKFRFWTSLADSGRAIHPIAGPPDEVGARSFSAIAFTRLETAGFLDLKRGLHLLLLRLLLLPLDLSARAFSAAFFPPSSNIDS